MAQQWQFLFAVFLMYGFIFTIYTLSDGSIYGLESANLLVDIPSEPSENPIIYFLETATYMTTTIVSFFFVLLINPFSNLWWMLPINWAILGTTVYLFIKMIRGGG